MADRTNQKRRTREAILRAAADLVRDGGEITMPAVARAALVSEATAYRYFPDLVSLLTEVTADHRPSPAAALAAAGDPEPDDPVVRIAAVTEHLLRHGLRYQSAIRAMIAATITRPSRGGRPGLRFGFIDHALAPAAGRLDPAALAQLKRDLAVVVSTDALFTLLDLAGLDPDDAVASLVRTATTLTRTALGRKPTP
jgi:AcrR family transcriptional regulator